jgi:hypothetical protein
VGDEATGVGGGLWPQARPGAGADGVQRDRPGLHPPAGGAPGRETAVAGCPRLRRAWAQWGRADGVSLRPGRQHSQASERLLETEEDLQRRVLTQSRAWFGAEVG